MYYVYSVTYILKMSVFPTLIKQKNKILLYFVFIITILSITATYHKYVVLKDFYIDNDIENYIYE